MKLLGIVLISAAILGFAEAGGKVGGFWSLVGFGACLGGYFAGLNGIGILTT